MEAQDVAVERAITPYIWWWPPTFILNKRYTFAHVVTNHNILSYFAQTKTIRLISKTHFLSQSSKNCG